MNIFELLGIQKPGPVPAPPRETLNSILDVVNGDAEVSTVLSAGITTGEIALPQWKQHRAELQQHRRQSAAEGVDAAKLTKLRTLEDRAESEIELLEGGLPALRVRLNKAIAEEQRQRRYHDDRECADEFEQIAEQAFALSKRAAELVKRVERGELKVNPLAVQGAAQVLQFLAGVIEERRPAIRAALATLRHEPPERRAMAAPAGPPAKRPLLPGERPPGSFQHAVTSNLSLPAGPLTAERAADDTSELAPGQARVRVLRKGWSPADNRPQCSFGQLVRVPRAVAEHAFNMGFVEIIEVHPASAGTVIATDWQKIPGGAASLTQAIAEQTGQERR